MLIPLIRLALVGSVVVAITTSGRVPSQPGDLPGALTSLGSLSHQHGWKFLCQAYGNKVYYVDERGARLIHDDGVSKARSLHHAYPAWSPDQKQVAFVKTIFDLSEGKSIRKEKIVLYRIDSGELTEILDWGVDEVYALAWSPLGGEIAFVSKGEEKTSGIFVIRLGERTVEQLVPWRMAGHSGVPSIDSAPSWSPDGRKLAFAMHTGASSRAAFGMAGKVMVVDRGSKIVVSLDDGLYPSWSPAGDLIVYFDVAAKNSFTVRPDGSGKKRLLRSSFFSNGRFALPAVWLSDGSQIAFHRFGETLGEGPFFTLYMRNVATGKTMKVYSRSEIQIIGWSERQPPTK